MAKKKIDLPRGFIASNRPFSGSREVAGLNLATHELTRVYSAKQGATRIILIGHAADINDPHLAEQAVADRLAQCGSIEEMADSTWDVIGRFAVIGRVKGKWFAFHDAGALRTIYFSSGEQWFVASHSILIADQTGRQRDEDLFAFYRGAVPGNRAAFPGVYILPANFYVLPHTGEMVRHWPRKHRVELPLDEAQEIFNRNLALAAKAICRSQKPILGITAGMDSRLSLALLRDVPGARFFSHIADVSSVKTDVRVAAEVCRISGVKHEIIELDRSPHPLDDRLIDYKHNAGVWRTYAWQLNAADYIYVRSVLPEIGMRFWHHNDVHYLTPRIASNLILNKTKRDEPGFERARQFAIGEFEQLLDVLGYRTERTFRGYDRLDLYYLEHRLTAWHGPILLGLDVAFETNIVFNTRRILETMLAVDDASRDAKSLFMGALTHFAPDLVHIPINPHKIEQPA